LGEFVQCPIVGHEIWSSFCEACGLFGPKCDHTPGDPELAEEFERQYGDQFKVDAESWLEERVKRWVEEHWIKKRRLSN